MNKQKLIEHIMKSDLTATEKRFLEERVLTYVEPKIVKCRFCGETFDLVRGNPKRGNIFRCRNKKCSQFFCETCLSEKYGKAFANEVLNNARLNVFEYCLDCIYKHNG